MGSASRTTPTPIRAALIDGARAILWHQGESDAFDGTSTEDYAEALSQIIEQSRDDAGFEISWGVARAAFMPDNTLEAELAVIAGQQLVIDSDSLVFAGPLTDDLIGPEWRSDTIHFNEAGLRLHAARWADAVLPRIVPEPDCSVAAVGFVVVSLWRRRKRKR